MREDHALSGIGVVCQSETVLDTALGIRADEGRQPTDEQFPELAVALLDANLSTREYRTQMSLDAIR